MTTTDWNPLLRGEFEKDYWKQLQRFIAEERTRAAVFPPPEETFAALHLTPFSEVKVLILGHDLGNIPIVLLTEIDFTGGQQILSVIGREDLDVLLVGDEEFLGLSGVPRRVGDGEAALEVALVGALDERRSVVGDEPVRLGYGCDDGGEGLVVSSIEGVEVEL